MDFYLEFVDKLLENNTIFSDDTLAIDIEKFKSGEMKRLFIVGLIGSGKTTISHKILSDLNVSGKNHGHLDDCKNKVGNRTSPEYYKCVYEMIKNPKYKIVEGVTLIPLYFKDINVKNIMLKNAMIVMGTSSLVSSLRAKERAEESVFGKEFWKTFLQNWQGELKLNQIKKDRINVPGSTVEKIS
ncbi:hypothetical protein M0R36_11240 [bacterium]|jgi:adenylate kinase family enzyme|nr:hypothetical protein [bacterium]